ncbi:hypothetical protein ACK3TF_000056 [Chlorella vulgaris]
MYKHKDSTERQKHGETAARQRTDMRVAAALHGTSDFAILPHGTTATGTRDLCTIALVTLPSHISFSLPLLQQGVVSSSSPVNAFVSTSSSHLVHKHRFSAPVPCHHHALR